MISPSSKTLSPSPFLPTSQFPKSQNPNHSTTFKSQITPHFSLYNPTVTPNSTSASQFHSERGLEFETGPTFFRTESATGRDLGILAAALYKKKLGTLRVLDAMCGCGVRSLRYLSEAGADFVLANDANDDYRSVIVGNLEREGRFNEGKSWIVVSNDANRVMTECYLKRDFFDLIDVDSFGSDSSFLRSAYSCLKLGGLLYVTSTDGYSSGGHRPQHALAAYGAYIRPMPYSNEIGLRMLIGGAIREASVLGFRITPLFSYYSYHGPVFRVMLQVNRGKLNNRHYGFISYCNQCGHSQSYSWDELGQICCPFNKAKECRSPVVSGPLWIGPLHNSTCIQDMANLAEKWDWIGDGIGTDLQKLLQQMLDESDPRLPFGYIKLDEVASRAKVNSPPLMAIMSKLQKEGFAVSRSHIASSAIKTNCPMATCIRIARELQGC